MISQLKEYKTQAVTSYKMTCKICGQGARVKKWTWQYTIIISLGALFISSIIMIVYLNLLSSQIEDNKKTIERKNTDYIFKFNDLKFKIDKLKDPKKYERWASDEFIGEYKFKAWIVHNPERGDCETTLYANQSLTGEFENMIINLNKKTIPYIKRKTPMKVILHIKVP